MIANPLRRMASSHLQELLLLLDNDKNGENIQAGMDEVHGGEFDRLDKDKTGELTPKELEVSKIRAGTKSYDALRK